MSGATKIAAGALLGFLLLIAGAGGGATIPLSSASECQPGQDDTQLVGDVQGVPKKWIPHYKAAAKKRKLGQRGPAILAAIHAVETDFGTSDLPGVKSGANSAGAKGPMQFLQPTWDAYGDDGDRDGDRDVYDNVDAIHGAANYLSASGAPADWYKAIFAYNHADWYVQKVQDLAEDFGQFNGIEPTTVSCEIPTGGPAELGEATRVYQPRTYKLLPARLIAPGFQQQAVDARIWDNVVWAMDHYGMLLTAARETGHASHGDGSAIDVVPAGDLSSQQVWDDSTGAFARDLGWTPGCASSGVAPACDLSPAIRFVGYDGYPSHGSPKTCGGGCPAHLHVSWNTASGGTAGLVPAPEWAMVFRSPAGAGGSSQGARS